MSSQLLSRSHFGVILKIAAALLVFFFSGHAHGGKAALKFGPEFEFVRKHMTFSKLPLRRQVFSEVVRKLILHLDTSDDYSLPSQWLQSSHRRINYDRLLNYQGKLAFQSTPNLWPDFPTEVFIDTANINDPSPEIQESSPQIRVQFSDDQLVQVFYSVDDVILEAHVNPMSLEEMRHFAPVVDDLVFSPSRQAPIRVPNNGGGHMHIDLLQILKRTDANDPKKGLWLLRNFLVDFYSHSHFVTYALRADPTWALILGMTSSDRLSWFKQAVQDLDEKIYSAKIESFDDGLRFIFNYFRPLHLLLPISLIDGDEYDRLLFTPEYNYYKPAIQFSKKLGTMEIRALSAQRSYQEFIDLAELFTGRLDYLAELDSPLPLPVWDDIKISPNEFKNKSLGSRSLAKLETELVSYLSGSMMHIPEQNKFLLKSRLLSFFESRLMRYVCKK